MITVSNETKEAFERGSSVKQIILSFTDETELTNKDIKTESIKLKEAISESDGLIYGRCCISEFDFSMRTASELRGKQFTASVQADDTDIIPLGIFVIDEAGAKDKSPSCDVKAYDRLKLFDVDVSEWYSGLVFPVTVKSLRDSLCAKIGVEQEQIELANDDMIIEKTVLADKLNGLDVLSAIAEINGAFCRMSRNGKLMYVTPSKTANDSISVLRSCKVDDYLVAPITGAQIRETETDLGGTYGELDNLYSITGNMLCYGKNESDLVAIAQNVFDVIGGITYKPCTLKIRGKPYLEPGDRIGFTCNDVAYESIIIGRTMSGIQLLIDDYVADGPELVDNKQTVKTQLTQIRQKSHELEINQDVLRSTIKDTNTKLDDTTDTIMKSISTEITQTKDEIAFKFESVESVQGKTDQKLNTINKYIRFVDGDIILDSSGKIAFEGDGQENGCWQNRNFLARDGEFINSLRLGKFAFLPRENGNLSFRKVKN